MNAASNHILALIRPRYSRKVFEAFVIGLEEIVEVKKKVA